MSSTTQCRRFVQNAWKKELCSNCFKSREEHATAAQDQQQYRSIAPRASLDGAKGLANRASKSILRTKEGGGKRKNVAFPESLIEIIGYDGGDDYHFGCAEDERGEDGKDAARAAAAGQEDGGSDHDDDDGGEEEAAVATEKEGRGGGGEEEQDGVDPDELPDSEEERALGNLTRANTSFNTVTANLSIAPDSAKAESPKILMLGRARTAGATDAKRSGPLVTVTPYNSDVALPTATTTARRPDDKKPKPSNDDSRKKSQPAAVIEPANKTVAAAASSEAARASASASGSTSLGKIVDMPLITSTSVASSSPSPSFLDAGRSTTNPPTTRAAAEQKQRQATSISRTPAIKKTDNERSTRVAREVAQQQQNSTKNLKPLSNGGVESRRNLAQNAPSFTSFNLDERKVEGEARDKCPESRESAGEPDGKADEESINEPSPPALPKSPPPLDVDSPPQSYTRSNDKRGGGGDTEPRTSFLHGVTDNSSSSSNSSSSKPIVKPAVPQKPASLPTKVVGSSLASLLSENRAYEFKLSQAKSNGPLAHSRSESHLSASGIGDQSEQLFKASVVKTVMKDEQGNDDDEEEEEEGNEGNDDDEEEEEDQRSQLQQQHQQQQHSCPSSSNKRRQAPLPPNVSNCGEDNGSSLFARNPNVSSSNGLKSDCPVVREKEKRERFRQGASNVSESTATTTTSATSNVIPSRDNLVAGSLEIERVEEKAKTKARTKFSLKKFLRMGSRKDVDMTCGSSNWHNDEIPSTPRPKPRLEIIHPLELDGAVQVLRSDKAEATTPTTNIENVNPKSAPHGVQHLATRPSKPPPPPRTQSQKSWQPSNGNGNGSSASDSIYANLGVVRIGLAPPVKPRRSSSMRDQYSHCSPSSSPITGTGTSTTASSPAARSVRPPLQLIGSDDNDNNNEKNVCPIDAHRWSQASLWELPVSRDRSDFNGDSSLKDRRNCDNDPAESVAEMRQRGAGHPIAKRQSDSGTIELKFKQSLFARSSSLPYCAGGADDEIYSPFSSSYRGSIENHVDSSSSSSSCIGRLRNHRQGRSVIHRSLEDNYGAVVVANHEALAQFLEQMSQGPAVPLGLRALKSASQLRLQDFVVEADSAVRIGRLIFLSAVWRQQQHHQNEVTLGVAFDPSSRHVLLRNEFCLMPIVKFCDALPGDLADLAPRKCSEATISVFPRLQVDSIKSFAEAARLQPSSSSRESIFVLLQLVSALKSLQARGIEEAPRALSNVVLCREDKAAYHRLYLFPDSGNNSLNSIDVRKIDENAKELEGEADGDKSEEADESDCTSLCQCALYALDELDLSRKLPLVRDLLAQEKAVTLSRVMSFLEFILWGPADIITLGGPRDRELALQRWLDLERATVLHALVRARAQICSAPDNVADEYQLLFLVRTSPKMMSEASLLLLDSQRRSGDKDDGSTSS